MSSHVPDMHDCPHCHSAVEHFYNNFWQKHAYCMGCGMRGPGASTEAEAAIAWNRITPTEIRRRA